MIYANAKKIFSTERNADFQKSVDILNTLLPDLSKNKIIYVIGDDTDACGAFVSSVIESSRFSIGRARDCFELEPHNIFSINGSCIPTQNICANLDRLASLLLNMGQSENAKSNRIFDKLPLSKESLACLFAFDYFAEKECDFILFECSEAFFESILSKLKIVPAVALFTSFDGEKISKFTDALPCATKEMICYSKDDNYDYISNKYSAKGTRISFVSQNKIKPVKTGGLGSDFYYNSTSYHIQAFEDKNIIYASLSLECISALSRLFSPFSRTAIYVGLEKAKLLFDLEIFSLSPMVILKVNNFDEDINPYFLQGKTVTVVKEEMLESATFHKTVKSLISNNGQDAILFTGSIRFINEIKKELTKIIK